MPLFRKLKSPFSLKSQINIGPYGTYSGPHTENLSPKKFPTSVLKCHILFEWPHKTFPNNIFALQEINEPFFFDP